MNVRLATVRDSAEIAAIYNQGIEDRTATFETRLRTAADVEAWFDDHHPIVVVEGDGRIVAFAATFTYRPRDCYRGIAEVSVYAGREWRNRSFGRTALTGLLRVAEERGFWKLV